MAFSFNLKASDTQQIVCYHCGTPQEVGRRAQTVTCRKCHKPLQVGDLKIKAYDARRKLQTTGSIVVEKKGQIVSDSVDCGELVIRGQVKAKNGITVRGTALVGPAATVTGDFNAHTLAVGAGASLEGQFCIGKDHMVPPVPESQAPDAEAVMQTTSA